MSRLKNWLPAFVVSFLAVVAGALLRKPQEPREPRASVAAIQVAPEPPLPDDVWAAAHGIQLPKPTIWPAVVGLGLTLALAGVASSLFISLFGALVLLWGIGGWITDLRDEASHGH